MRRHLLVPLLAACALLAVPSLAAAHPVKRDFSHTFPHASRLCDRAAAGDLPKRLTASAAKVKAACDTLHTSFDGAQTTFTTAVTPLRQQATDAITALRATCKQARADHNPGACKAARESTRATIKGLRTQVRDAAKTYHEAIQTARKTFWSTIKGLRGGGSIDPDRTSGPDPQVTLPSDAQVVAA